MAQAHRERLFQLYKVYHGNNNSQNAIYEVRCKT